MRIEKIPRPDWEPLPFAGCEAVEGKVLLRTARLTIAMLRFAARATTHEHAAGFDIDVICLDGAGFVSVGGEVSPLAAGDRLLWPAGASHRLWTQGTTLLALTVEHLAG